MKVIERYWRGDIAHADCQSAVESLADVDDADFAASIRTLAQLIGRLIDESPMTAEQVSRVLGHSFDVVEQADA